MTTHRADPEKSADTPRSAFLARRVAAEIRNGAMGQPAETRQGRGTTVYRRRASAGLTRRTAAT
jgi:hypothetical protein